MGSPLALVFVLTLGLVAGQKFNREFMGVAFSPYTDHNPARYWDGYSVEDIMAQLSTVRNYFSSISTYSMGVAGYNQGKPWDQCDSNALIARAAATLNQQSSTKLRVNIGVYQNAEDQGREINNAFEAAIDANNRAAGTVWGITFTNEYIHSFGEAVNVLDMIRNNKGRANSLGLRVGARTEICGAILGGDLQGIFQEIVRNSDYIYCNVYPSNEHAQLPPSRAAEEVGYYLLYLQSEIKKVNGNIEVMIGETGWPSEGNSFNGSPNSVQNEAAYWHSMNNFASQNRIQTQMFQAIDEPWKSDNSQFKAEGHYGWWTKPNNRENRFVEKEG
ncbi:unnamed protein product [Allacma fusca]|uniref:glucan endo-1,3-beta-D-glucosidase n=1 Tax=Allacma fusca TaxID=39272 RepID=A0A8J2J6Q9_9HEXA|nr:unnamed protein product [Allacma fusca]